jgi:phosphoribosylamine-glycine ligase
MNSINARQMIYKRLDELDWQGGFYRKDIGHKVIK